MCAKISLLPKAHDFLGMANIDAGGQLADNMSNVLPF
jgi:hypothetical protein